MNNNQKYQLVIKGAITSDEFNKARKYFFAENIEISRSVTKTVEPSEIIQLIFRDFDAYTFLRDGILFTFLAERVKKIFLWFRKNIEEKRRPKVIWIHVIFEKDNAVKLSVNLYLPDDKDKAKIILEQLKIKFTVDYITKINKHEIWTIGYDNNGVQIQIFKL